MQPVITFALAKGRLAEQALSLLENMGFDCSEPRNPGRQLVLWDRKNNVRFILVKPSDVPTYVDHGVADLGVVGKDTILEHGSSFYELLDLGFGKCRFALATKKGDKFFGGYDVKTIASKYPNVARSFFESKGMDVEIVKIEGSVELAPLLELSDGIVDIVETGTTLKENGLEVIEDIAPISARLIVNTVSMKLKKDSIDALVEKMIKALSEGEK